MLAEQIENFGHSGEHLDKGTIIPADICLPLLQLGYDSFADLLCRQRKPTLISTTDLCRIHGHRVKRGHKLERERERDYNALASQQV